MKVNYNGVLRLAQTLMNHVYGEGAWEVFDDEDVHESYIEDAIVILEQFPHLASYSERRDV